MTGSQGFGSFGHLAQRFFGALAPGGPPPGDEAWAQAWLEPGERGLWIRMSGPDRRHAVGVARDTRALLESGGHGPVPREVMAAALLHDVGKIESGLGTWSRVAVTVLAMLLGRSRVAAWADQLPSQRESSKPPGPLDRWRRAAGRYVTHDRIGAHLLTIAGSGELTVAWAGEHHRPAETWTVPRPFADALKAADGD